MLLYRQTAVKFSCQKECTLKREVTMAIEIKQTCCHGDKKCSDLFLWLQLGVLTIAMYACIEYLE